MGQWLDVQVGVSKSKEAEAGLACTAEGLANPGVPLKGSRGVDDMFSAGNPPSILMQTLFPRGFPLGIAARKAPA